MLAELTARAEPFGGRLPIFDILEVIFSHRVAGADLEESVVADLDEVAGFVTAEETDVILRPEVLDEEVGIASRVGAMFVQPVHDSLSFSGRALFPLLMCCVVAILKSDVGSY